VPRLHSNRDRPFHLGVLPTEHLPRDPAAPAAQARMPDDRSPAGPAAVAAAIPAYRELLLGCLDGDVAPRSVAVPGNARVRADNLKASAYFLEATLAGVCSLAPDDWSAARSEPHTHAFVFVVEFGREPAPDEPGAAWIAGSNADWTDLRCAEIAAVLAGYLRALGYPARGHVAGATTVAIERLAQRAGVARAVGQVEGVGERPGEDSGNHAVDGDGPAVLRVPMLSAGFRIGVVTTEYAMACDLPLAADAPLGFPDPDAFAGVDGTRPGWWDDELARRPVHLGRYPMERIRRVDEPTTLILRDEIVRVTRRSDFFTRALAGDLGPKPKAERGRFATKHPLALAMTPLIRVMVPLQGSRGALPAADTPEPAAQAAEDLSDPLRNAEALKALAYFLGADLAGICRAESWMYHSLDETGSCAIDAYHRFALVILLDQGFETMEGAAGDDWISGAQSMRAYLRGALMAGVIVGHLQRLGHSARAHTSAHSEVLHLPAVLMAGLGELPRIGELVLNPFIGPRSKSVLVTTSLPLAADRPIDFGLQRFCELCRKCARECPCNAISFGPKIMYNGYEIWKPDVERCAKYRLTNARGSACGRCMKTCPWDSEDLVESDRLRWMAIEDPASHPWLIAHDDAIGAGARNPVKRWWFDLEIVDGVAVRPPGGTNEHDLDPGRVEKLAKGQKLAIFPPALHPPPGTSVESVVPVDRQAGLRAAEKAESPVAARRRAGR